MYRSVIAGLLLGVPGLAAGQGVTSNDAASVSVEVVSGITITKSSDVDFGNVAQGQGTVTLTATGGLSSSTGVISQTAATVGKFVVTGFATAQFSIAASADPLEGPGTDITFTPVLYGNGTDNAGGATQGVTAGTLVDDAGTGKFYIYVGGSIAVPAGQATGAYSGDVTVTVTYTHV